MAHPSLKFFLSQVPLDAKGCDMRGVYHGEGSTFYMASNPAGASMTVGPVGWTQAGAKAVAWRTAVQGAGGAGGVQRRGPVGGAA